MTTAIIMCPSFTKYPTAPDDQPNCIEAMCPICSKQMWLSIAKRNAVRELKIARKQYQLFCYDCFEGFAELQAILGKKDFFDKLKQPIDISKIIETMKNET